MTRFGLLAVYTEGDSIRGLGHVSRCSAYAQAWLERGGRVCWILDGDDAAVALIGTGQEIIRRPWQKDGRRFDLDPDVALVDSYVASTEVMETIAAGSGTTIFIDDLGRTYPQGLVVHPAPDRIACAPSETIGVLNGPSWQPLRPPFWDPPARAAVRPGIERILVVFGGGDLRGTGVAMAGLALKIHPSVKIDLVLGASQPVPEAAPGLLIHRSIDASAMVSLMLAADIAITAAGQTVFELARCGTPAILVGVADNQKPNLDHWPSLCGYINAGAWNDEDLEARVTAAIAHLADPIERQAIGHRAVNVVDGQGVRRLFDYLDRHRVQESA